MISFSNRYWPVIDDALRRAAFDRKVQVRLMASLWNHTRPDLKQYLRSLAAMNGANSASVQVVCIHSYAAVRSVVTQSSSVKNDNSFI